MMGISIWQLLIVLAIVILIFGTKKLKNMGGDIGGAVKNFKSAMKGSEEDEVQQQLKENAEENVESATEKEKTNS